ncbi:MAG: sulfotransferase [Balneolaceae bacterium]|nr:sulfotransferase [Balneolaceae bacterium]
MPTLGMDEHEIIVPQKIFYKTSYWVLLLLRNIDKLAAQQGNASTARWIEKTLRHLQYLPLLADVDPSIKFIHMMRRGQHVVPSLYFATQKNPEAWDGARSLKKCVFWWNRSVELSLKYLGAPNHMHVSYAQVTEEPEKIAEVICGFLELEFETNIVDGFHKTAESLIKDSEEWKQKNRSSEIDASSKLSRLNKKQQAYVKNHIVDFPFERIRV